MPDMPSRPGQHAGQPALAAGGRRGGRPRRRWPVLAVCAAASLLLAACGSATGSGKTGNGGTGGGHAAGGTTVTAWLVTSGPSPANTLVTSTAKRFEASHPGDHITVDFIENTPFKQKIRLAMGAGNPPTIFWTWGGGILGQYVNAGDVQPLGQPSWASRFLPVTLSNVTFNGKLYGVPIEGTQPVYFFYNKSVMKKAGLATFPATWSGLLSAVHTLKAHGVTPVALANAAGWPGLMYLEYLTDRIGGSGAVKAILDGKPGAWSSPAVIQALTDIQQLVRAGAFQQGYDSLHFGSGGSDALVYSGKAAMQLMGDWDISSILGSDKSFVTSGQLGMAPFPAVTGGKGNPADLEGNTASYVAIASHASMAQKKVAEQFLQELSTVSYAKGAVAAGEVPVIKGAASLFNGQQLASFDKTIYSSVEQAPSFQYSWDQSLGPSEAQAMLTNLEQVFELTETPQKFVSVMNSKGSPG
ncbi:MAG TPA: extracellular solute-binding protein [Streptosporangiaceae bacterium]|nr:extracellular solute-binding protein [Streptosporangiaceae bacterium]